MKAKLFFILLALGSLCCGCKKEYTNIYQNYYQQPKDSTIIIISPQDSAMIHDSVPVQFYLNKKLKVVRMESYVDFNLLKPYDTVPSTIYFNTKKYEIGSMHNYFIRIITKEGSTYNSNIITLIITNLSRPVLGVTFLTKTSLKLSWQDKSISEEGFHIFRKEGIGDYNQIGDVPKNSESFTDNAIDTTKSYTYTVEVYSAVDSLTSDPLSVQFFLDKYVPYKDFYVDPGYDGNIRLTPDAKRAVVTNYDLDNVTVITISNGSKSYLSHPGGTLGIAMSHNGNFCATGGSDPSYIVKIWDLNSMSLIRNINTNGNETYGLTINEADDRLIVGGEPVQIYDLANGMLVKDFGGNQTFIKSVVFSSDESVLLGAGNGGIARLWNSTSGEVIRNYTGSTNYFNKVCFNPDETKVLCAGGGSLVIWDRNNGQILDTIRRANGISSIEPIRDGDMVVGEGLGKLFILKPDGRVTQQFGGEYSQYLFDIDYNSELDMIAVYLKGSVQLYLKIGHWESVLTKRKW